MPSPWPAPMDDTNPKTNEAERRPATPQVKEIPVIKRRGALAIAGVCILAGAPMARAAAPPATAVAQVTAVVNRFERALQERNPAAVEALVSEDLVVFENGHRNDGWIDFRDNHLIPELKEPATPSEAKLVKVNATAEMAWAYTRTDLFAHGKAGEKPTHQLWSIYVIEKRPEGWKIVMLDWSIAKMKY